MTTLAEKRAPARGEQVVPPLENGAHLSATEFLRRYEAMPEVKKAELVDGITFMGSPIRAEQHGEPDNLVQGWLCYYTSETPNVKAAANTTVKLGPDDVLQPDGLLRIVEHCGGRARIDAKGYLAGPPEFVVEVAASSASMDVSEKLASYRRAGVLEYLVWRTEDGALDWWGLDEDEYRPLPADRDGVIRSRIFPGLWLDTAALLEGNGSALMRRSQDGLKSPEHSRFVESLEQSRRR